MKLGELLVEHNIPHRAYPQHEHTRPGWLQVDCPGCSKGWNHFRLGVNLSHFYANCWACGPADLYGVLVSHGVPKQAVAAFCRERPRERVPTAPNRGKLVLPRHGPLTAAHRVYLRRRGFAPTTVATVWGLKGITIHPRLGWRILIPIVHNGEMVSWTTRAVGEGVRYLSAKPEEEKLNHRELLYGEDLVPGHAVIVHEGPADVWRTGPGAVATFGTGFQRAQVLRLSRYPTRVVCFDSEPAAQEMADKLCSLLAPFPGRTINVRLESGKDAADCDEAEIEQLRGYLK